VALPDSESLIVPRGGGFMLRCLAAFAVVFGIWKAGPCVGQESYTLKLNIGPVEADRHQIPMRHVVHVPAGLSQAPVTIVDARGRSFLGQLCGLGLTSRASATGDGMRAAELHFVLPSIDAEETLDLEVRVGRAERDVASFHWQDTPGKYSDLRFGDRNVLRYMYEPVDNSSPERRDETYKVYHHIFDPAGAKLLTKGSGGLFPHHRGLFYGFNRISYGDGQTADIWHCRKGEAQVHRQVLAQEAGPVLGRHRLAIDWIGQDGQIFAREQREIAAYHLPQGMAVEFVSQLESAGKPVKLDGDPQHAGVQFRATQHVPDVTKHLTYYVRPDGPDKPGSFRNWPGDAQHVNLPWNAMSFVVDDQRYTCCYLDHPGNPKEARYSERDYGRFGSYFEYALTDDTPLNVQYRLWLQEGEMTVDQVQKVSDDFVAAPRVTGQ
jgi:hypothetical protein